MGILTRKFWVLVWASLALAASAPSHAESLFHLYKDTYDLSPGSRSGCYGSTFFSFMKNQVKPDLDRIATRGFEVVDGQTLVDVLDWVDTKVSRKAKSAAGGVSGLKRIGNALEGKTVTLYTLPGVLLGQGIRNGEHYDLSTYIALASGGGVAIKLDGKNYFYNVNYGTGKNKDDERTGRSFGKGPKHEANDASDKMYLQELQASMARSGREVLDFYRTLMEILTNCDSRGYATLSGISQTAMTDFLAIYTAEQDRHLMANLRSHHWDTALLQVTLLGAFHSGQKKIRVYYDGKFTYTTHKQSPDNSRSRTKKADLTDWWQFSKQGNGRSGINITRRDFEKLSRKITEYERKQNPALVKAVEKELGVSYSRDIFESLADYLVNFKTSSRLRMSAYDLTEAMVAYLDQVREDAEDISVQIERGWLRSSAADEVDPQEDDSGFAELFSLEHYSPAFNF